MSDNANKLANLLEQTSISPSEWAKRWRTDPAYWITSIPSVPPSRMMTAFLDRGAEQPRSTWFWGDANGNFRPVDRTVTLQLRGEDLHVAPAWPETFHDAALGLPYQKVALELLDEWTQTATAAAIMGTPSDVTPAGPVTLTLETLQYAIAEVFGLPGKLMKEEHPMGYSLGCMLAAGVNYRGVPIVFSPLILRDTEERLFPETRNRSRRVLKKLLRRYGSEFRRVPAIWISNGTLYAHPTFRQKLVDAGMQQ